MVKLKLTSCDLESNLLSKCTLQKNIKFTVFKFKSLLGKFSQKDQISSKNMQTSKFPTIFISRH